MSCSDSFPSTEVFYSEISSDVPVIVLLAVACVLTLVIAALFLDEHVYLRKIHTNNPLRQRRVVTLLGLYPMISGMALLSLLVPACTQMVDLIASCYLSVCIYMFVCLMVEYFGGEEKMVAALADDKIRMNTPPCCCCCFCLPKITLTKKSLYYIQLLALQVAIIRPLLLFIAAVLWTDGKYVQGEVAYKLAEAAKGNGQQLEIYEMLGLTRPSTYIYNISAVSLMLSIYGQFFILWAIKPLTNYRLLRVKLFVTNIVGLFLGLQNLVFGILAKYDVISCVGSRGAFVRASNYHHGVLVFEMFLLALVARYAYRRPNSDLKPSINDGHSLSHQPNKNKANGHIPSIDDSLQQKRSKAALDDQEKSSAVVIGTSKLYKPLSLEKNLNETNSDSSKSNGFKPYAYIYNG